MKTITRVLSVAGLLLWLGYSIAYPPWVGRFYNPDPNVPNRFWPGGTFGLEGSPTSQLTAPIWKPPKAHSDVIHASVRWPWQPIRQHEHIEIAMVNVIARVTLGVIAIGLILGFIALFSLGTRPDMFVSIAFSLSIALLLAWGVAYFIAAVSAGYGPDEQTSLWIVGVATVVGCTAGVLSYAVRRALWNSKQRPPVA